MRYIKDNVITSSPTFKNVVNPSHEYIISQGWKVYEEPEPTPYEQAMQNWHEPTYALRIIAPNAIADENPQMLLFLYKLEKVRGLPIENDGQNMIIYCNEIMAGEQMIIDSDSRIIVENNPNHGSHD